MAVLQDGSIIINEWSLGIGKSPVEGFADMRNVDIHNPSGILKIALAPTKISSTTVTQLPTWMSYDKTVDAYYTGGYLDGDNVYKIDGGVVSTLSGSSIGQGTLGGITYKGYLIVADHQTGTVTLDAMRLSNGVWTNAFETLGTGFEAVPTPMLWAQDDGLYIGNTRYVGKLSQHLTNTFNPAGSEGTDYDFSDNVLDLASDFYIETFSELSGKLYAGASRNLSAVSGPAFYGALFPWNFVNESFNAPIILDRGVVRQMISRNGRIIFANGQKVDLLATNGTFTEDIPFIGSLKINPPSSSGIMFNDAKAFVNGEYLFGVSTNETDFTPAGVYGFKDGAWRFLQISTGSTGTVNQLLVGVIYPKDDTNFYVGWRDNNTYGIDEFGASNYRYTGYAARVDSPFYRVGTALQKKQFEEISFYLAKPLTTGQGVRLSYRLNLSDSFTIIGTYDFATYGAITSYTDSARIPNTDQIQIRIELTTGSSSTTTPELKEVTVK